jgi:hypothetical protein
MNLDELVDKPADEIRQELLTLDFTFEQLEGILYKVPELGITLFRMSMQDYKKTAEKYLTPLSQNISSAGIEEHRKIMFDYLCQRKEESEEAIMQDVATLNKTYKDLAGMIADVYRPKEVPAKIISFISEQQHR